MTVQIPSANTLLDQTFFSQMATDLNALNDKITKQASQIYNTTTDKQVTSFAGSFAISTNQVSISHILSTTDKSKSDKVVSFNAGFVAPPIVVATIQSSNSTSSVLSNLTSVVVSDVRSESANISINVNSVLALPNNAKTTAIDIIVNIVAIGLVSL